jgi:feruloyl esterase
MKSIAIAFSIIFFLAPQRARAGSCEDLPTISLPDITVTAAQEIAAGKFTQFPDLPAFCRVMVIAKPTKESDTKIEVWLPISGWNGKFQPGSLGSGIPGGIRYGSVAALLKNGYATGATISYNSLGDMTNKPDRLIDWVYRGTHEFTVTAKALARTFYGSGPKLSLLNECGGSSLPSLNIPGRFPDDYDALAVGGYTADRTHMSFGQMWPWVVTHRNEASALPQPKLRLLNKAAMDVCDAADGIKDGIIDPTRCNFDPKILECKGADSPTCLTSGQVQAARDIYEGPTNPRTKEKIYFGYPAGTELGWAQLTGLQRTNFSSSQGYRLEPSEFFKHLVFKDPNWTFAARPLDFDKDVDLANSEENRLLDATRNSELTDLKKFIDRGGKLLLHGGLADSGVPPGGIIDYYKKLETRLGPESMKRGVRLFMVPGMGHCPGIFGEENINFDAQKIIEQWSETGKPPDQLIVTRYKKGIEAGKRLVCPYPQCVGSYK